MQEGQQYTGDAGEGEFTTPGRNNIPTDLLRTFVAICELGSFTKTANLLDLTQPAVSAHMRRLESIIGADLITKSLTGVVLTECGGEVLRHARRMLAINDQIVSGSGVEAQPQVVRVGIPNIHAPAVLAGILREERPSETNIGCRFAATIRMVCCAASGQAILSWPRPNS
jgi:DNA-binding transcriptional LysR family regulator